MGLPAWSSMTTMFLRQGTLGRAGLPGHHADVALDHHLLEADALDPLWHLSWVDGLARLVLHDNNVLEAGNLVAVFIENRAELPKGFVGADDSRNLSLGDDMDDAIVPKVGVQSHNGHRVLETAISSSNPVRPSFSKHDHPLLCLHSYFSETSPKLF